VTSRDGSASAPERQNHTTTADEYTNLNHLNSGIKMNNTNDDLATHMGQMMHQAAINLVPPLENFIKEARRALAAQPHNPVK